MSMLLFTRPGAATWPYRLGTSLAETSLPFGSFTHRLKIAVICNHY